MQLSWAARAAHQTAFSGPAPRGAKRVPAWMASAHKGPLRDGPTRRNGRVCALGRASVEELLTRNMILHPLFFSVPCSRSGSYSGVSFKPFWGWFLKAGF